MSKYTFRNSAVPYSIFAIQYFLLVSLVGCEVKIVPKFD
jgi:hypothetical protein